jgi:predicted DCC family thiol-disulfide oxidoreductase YuxK
VPVLIYDGRCGFCAIWVNYWRLVTGERVTYVPSQEVADQYPEISAEEFKRSVWLVHPDGTRTSGAEAVFGLMAYGHGKNWPLWMYRHVPGFGWASEVSYRFIARHRSFFYWVTRIFWGTQVEPSTYRRTSSLFLRGLALVYFVAFISLIPQIIGLIGEHGILPARDYLETIRSEFGGNRYAIFPTLAWLNSSNVFIQAMCWSGAVLAIALLVGVAPIPVAAGLYVLYLSINTIGQAFLSFQWDSLLLEAGFAAILLAPWGLWPGYKAEPPKIPRWVLRFLIFRLMLESGAVKLLSGDPAWRGLTALNFHYETQPLPTPLAWYAHKLPEAFQKFSVGTVFFVELAVPFLFFMPRRLRIIGAWITIAFQLIIAATGNYTFFNLLTIVLCIPLFDDRHFRRSSPLPLGEVGPSKTGRVRVAISLLIIAIGLFQLVATLGFSLPLPGFLYSLDDYAQAFQVVNHYGLFAVMTTSRPEIIIEGSDDGENWKSYEFPFKAGDVLERPRWVAPFQPRLDWQMWFAALGSYRDAPWFSRLIIRLLEGSPEVVGFLEKNPFPDKPPHFIRAVTYDYHFSDVATRRSTGAWWTRQSAGQYFPSVSLKQ